MPHPASGHYGALAVPAQLPAPGEAVTDPVLTLLGGYFRAFVNTYAGAAWGAVAHAGLPVKRFFAHDPREVALSDNDFPSLYLFRSGGDPPERIAEGYRITSDTVSVLWIFPREGSEDIGRQRRPFVAGLVKMIDKALWRMRDPCFVVVGDRDPQAAEHGSNVYGLGAIHEMRMNGRWSLVNVTVGGGETEPVTYPAVLISLLLRERDTQVGGPAPQTLSGPATDPDLLLGDDSPYGVDVTFTTSDGAVVTAEYLNGP